jgi:hypothetical protein
LKIFSRSASLVSLPHSSKPGSIFLLGACGGKGNMGSVREQRRIAGELGPDQVVLQATDQLGAHECALHGPSARPTFYGRCL